MRTIEVLFAIIVIMGAFVLVLYFAVLPSPQQMFAPSLRELASSTLETLDADGNLSMTVFNSLSDPSWADLQMAIAAALPANLVYNLSIYEVLTSPEGVVTYNLITSLSDSAGQLGSGSQAASYLVTSSDVTFTITPQKIGEREGKKITLYILNCNDSNGWWITGYTGQTLASDLQNLLSPYFERTVLVNTTAQLGSILNNVTLAGEDLEGAVVINTFGEAIPIPTEYCEGYAREDEGYDSSRSSYARYCHTLGERVNQFNWTWVSIVGYPLYYVTNTDTFAGRQNTWGIYGMAHVGPAGLKAFIRGIDGRSYSYDSEWITAELPGVVQFSPDARYLSNYYGTYPAPYQSSGRALRLSELTPYNLVVKEGDYVFNPVSYGGSTYIPGATFSHIGADGNTHGALTALGLTRIPDIRVTGLALLMHYRPAIYRSEFGASGTSRLVVLQLSQQGGS